MSNNKDNNDVVLQFKNLNINKGTGAGGKNTTKNGNDFEKKNTIRTNVIK